MPCCDADHREGTFCLILSTRSVVVLPVFVPSRRVDYLMKGKPAILRAPPSLERGRASRNYAGEPDTLPLPRQGVFFQGWRGRPVRKKETALSGLERAPVTGRGRGSVRCEGFALSFFAISEFPREFARKYHSRRLSAPLSPKRASPQSRGAGRLDCDSERSEAADPELFAEPQTASAEASAQCKEERGRGRAVSPTVCATYLACANKHLCAHVAQLSPTNIGM